MISYVTFGYCKIFYIFIIFRNMIKKYHLKIKKDFQKLLQIHKIKQKKKRIFKLQKKLIIHKINTLPKQNLPTIHLYYSTSTEYPISSYLNIHFLKNSLFTSSTTSHILTFIQDIIQQQSYTVHEQNNYHQAQYLYFQISNSEREELEIFENNVIQIRNMIYPKNVIFSIQPFLYKDKDFILKNEYKKNCMKICQHTGLHFIENETISNIYSTIYDLFIKSQKEVIQVYFQKEQNYGLGDCIRGVAQLCYYLKNTGYQPKVSFTNHPLSHFFYSKTFVPEEKCNNILFYTFNILKNLSKFQKNIYFKKMFQHKYIFSQIVPKSVSPKIKKFIKENCLTPRISFQKKMTEFQNYLGLKNKQYYVIHVRLHDGNIDSNKVFQKFKHKILHVKKMIDKTDKNKNKKILIMSSNSLFLDSIHFHFLTKTNLSRGHLGQNQTSLEQTQDTMIELMLMTKAKKIYQLSVYHWGSNFSKIANMIYNVPIQRIKL